MTPTPHSSNVAGYEYNAATGTLRVQFKSGGTYDYPGVPAHIVDQMASAPSIGSFIHHTIKPRYAGKKVVIHSHP